MTSTATTRKTRKATTTRKAAPKKLCVTCGVERTPNEKKRDAELKGKCEQCHEKNTPALVEEPETVEATTTGRVCGNCDTNIDALPEAVEFCSKPCQQQARKTMVALPSDIRDAVKGRISDTMTDYEIRTGLRAAWRLRKGRTFGPAAIAAAARVWFPGYDEPRNFARGQQHTKVLRTLAAVRDLVEG